jgi:hypothetical protein
MLKYFCSGFSGDHPMVFACRQGARVGQGKGGRFTFPNAADIGNVLARIHSSRMSLFSANDSTKLPLCFKCSDKIPTRRLNFTWIKAKRFHPTNPYQNFPGSRGYKRKRNDRV